MWHQRALVQFRSTGGDTHYSTAWACYKVAEHHIRRQEYPQARSLLEQVLKAYQDRPYYRQEIARTTFLFARLHRLLGDDVAADRMLEMSVDLVNALFPDRRCSPGDLTEDDFDGFSSYEF